MQTRTTLNHSKKRIFKNRKKKEEWELFIEIPKGGLVT
jgi:hypothetical protein